MSLIVTGAYIAWNGKRADRYKIAGTVTVDGAPAKRYVSAYDRTTFQWIATTISDRETGAWILSGLPQYQEQGLLVIAQDTTGNYNAEVADYVTQVATT